ncbi:hypothetical protein RN001_006282 [Aquatica leii]|uniref:Na(+)/K(+)-exchanging ATPase n=1 Tax=Aquatica leii TaxID=1421715 RepID=A0AAN7QKW6_9COLE|nr:hypothetical protein RN001_006282 [Aquatica leii]
MDLLCQRLSTNSISGLTKEQAKTVLASTGYNTLTPFRKTSEFVKFIKVLFQGFSKLLWFGALLCFGSCGIQYIYEDEIDFDNVILGLVLMFVVLLTTIMDCFKHMIPQKATVIRDGHTTSIDCKDVVVGDLVQLKYGHRIPADVRIIESHNFKVDNSSLTGESEPIIRTSECTNDNVIETKNVAFFSTTAVEGVATGIVIACGDNTVMGRIAGLTTRLRPNRTPIANEIRHFMRIISAWAPKLISLIGLIAAVTVCLTVTAKVMASKNCLIKNLEAVETLGSTSIICSDKTGTLTQNRMTVCHLWFNLNTYLVGVDDKKQSEKYKLQKGAKAFLRCATLCNRAEFESDTDKLPVNKREIIGDASEAAILKFIEMSKMYPSSKDYRARNKKLFEIPFSSESKYQVSERVLGFADLELESKYNWNYPFSMEPLNFPLKNLRFLGFIALIDPPRPQVPDAVFKCRSAGIKVIMVTGDHPVTATAIAKQVGIITTDDIVDPEDVSGTVPLIGSCQAIVIHGSTLRDLAVEELDNIVFHYKEIVFARTSPTQKLQIVESCQRLGEIVAVTGDGVNDSPALKKADIGISMGISGTEVSQQSADMILLDDNFASIIVGIEEGRRIFDNLKKTVAYILASNVPELLTFFAFIALSIPLPLGNFFLTMQYIFLKFLYIGVIAILCIDLLTDMMPAISLAYEKAESDILQRPPRNARTDKLVTRKMYFLAYGHIGVIEAAAAFFTYFTVMAEHGFMPERLIEWTYHERKVVEYTCYTAIMVSVVVTQWADLLVCKTRRNSIFKQGKTVNKDTIKLNSIYLGMSNHILNVSIIIETLVVCFLSYGPEMSILKFYPVRFRWWLYPLPFAFLIIVFDELRKYEIRRNPKGWVRRETYY